MTTRLRTGTAPETTPGRASGEGCAGTVLIATGDDVLLDDLLRLCAAAGVVPDVAHDPGSAMRSWRSAALVLVGGDQAAGLAAVHPARRTSVHVVVGAPPADELFRTALALGAENVAELPMSEGWLVEMVTDAADGGAGRALTVGVMSGHGGAGSTTFAAALALTGARRGATVLMDVDPWGPGIDRVVGFDGIDGVRWDALARITGRLGARSLRESLPVRDGLGIVTWHREPAPVPAFALREVLSAAQRGHDLVVLDLPRTPDPVLDEVAGRCDHVLLVSGLTVPAVTSAAHVAARLRGASATVHLVTRSVGGGVAPEEASRVLRVPLIAAMADQRGLTESVDLGSGPLPGRRGVLARTARSVLAVIGTSRAAAA